jgi:enoyl-CoA hydratase/carnithine racemase
MFRKVSAKVASEMGLVGRAVPPDSLTEEGARALTGMIAANNSRTLGHGKAAVDLNPETTIGRHLHYETVTNGATHASENYEIDLSP